MPRVILSALLLCATLATAEVQRIEIQTHTTEGPYERIVARVFFAVDPKAPANQNIADIALAPLNAQGKVEFSSDLLLLRPKAPSKSRKSVFLEVVNRGGPQSLGLLSGGQQPRQSPNSDQNLGTPSCSNKASPSRSSGGSSTSPKPRASHFRPPSHTSKAQCAKPTSTPSPQIAPSHSALTTAPPPQPAQTRAFSITTASTKPAQIIPQGQWHFFARRLRSYFAKKQRAPDST